MQATMPFQVVPEANTGATNRSVTRSGNDERYEKKANQAFENILGKEINDSSEVNENIIEEVAEMIRQNLTPEELSQLSDGDLEGLIKSLISESSIDSETIEITPFLKEVKKLVENLNIESTKVKSSLEKLDGNAESADDSLDFDMKDHSQEMPRETSGDKSVLNNNFRMQLEGMAKLIAEPLLKEPKENLQVNKFESLMNKDGLNLLNNDTLTEMDSAMEKTEILKVEKPQDILKLVDMINIAKSGKNTKLTVQLTPAELGKVNIQLTEVSGKIAAKFMVDNEHTKAMLLQQVDAIKNQLSEKGIVIDDMDFMFMGDFNSKEQFSRQGQNSTKNESSHEGIGFTSTEVEEVENNSGLYA